VAINKVHEKSANVVKDSEKAILEATAKVEKLQK